MNIDITIHAVKDAHGICAIHPEATIWFSPKEGFDADKLRRTEEDLTDTTEVPTAGGSQRRRATGGR